MEKQQNEKRVGGKNRGCSSELNDIVETSLEHESAYRPRASSSESLFH